jgi:hypothetical protein
MRISVRTMGKTLIYYNRRRRNPDIAYPNTVLRFTPDLQAVPVKLTFFPSINHETTKNMRISTNNGQDSFKLVPSPHTVPSQKALPYKPVIPPFLHISLFFRYPLMHR